MSRLHRLAATLLLTALAALPGAAMHPRTVGALEGELRVGVSLPLGGYRGGRHNESASLGLEGRVNLSDSPWDVGLSAGLSCAERRFGELSENNESTQNNRTINILAISHYNLNQGGKFNPFVGLGVGAAYCNVLGERYYPITGWYAAVAPRLGVEFVSHARITLHFNLSRKGFNNFTVTFGAVLGGKERKQKTNDTHDGD